MIFEPFDLEREFASYETNEVVSSLKFIKIKLLF